MWDELEDNEEGASKYCLAWGDSHISGVDTMILGEVYVTSMVELILHARVPRVLIYN